MYFYEGPCFAPQTLDVTDPLSTYYLDDPIGDNPSPDSTGSIQYTTDGIVVVGAENANEGQMALIAGQDGKILAIAFGDDDGNWWDELGAVGSGLACVGGIGATLYSSGTISVFTGVATAGACASFAANLGTLSSSYSSNPAYTQSVTVHLDSGLQTYTYTYASRGSWSIVHDPATGVWSEWKWSENVKNDAG